MKGSSRYLLAPAIALLTTLALPGAEIDLRPQWDATRALANPHKGWYHHYFDNTIEKYLVENDAELTGFPGMDHLYLRLAWAYLEPAEGRFDWHVVDEPIAKWTARGMGIAFRISCRETGTNRVEQQFATPRWVRDAGAKGGFYLKRQPVGPDGPWEPVYDDPIFLAKLDRFLAAFAARYDGKPWLRYVDIGSVGDWGEGHTSSGSGRKYGFASLKPHVEIHLKHFRKTQLVVSDDFTAGIPDASERARMHAYLIANGVSYRDDSILVDWWLSTRAQTCSVNSPDSFRDAEERTPTVLELEHYGIVKQKGNWIARPDSSLAKAGGGRSGADILRGALELLRATYIGYHGYAREWLADNPALTVELLNRCGYWFFPHTIALPDTLVAGQPNAVAVTWENRGVARAYHPYSLLLRLEGPQTIEVETASGNTRWLPGMTSRESYAIALPETFPAGDYCLKLKLHCREQGRDVRLPLKAALLDKDGYSTVGRTRVSR